MASSKGRQASPESPSFIKGNVGGGVVGGEVSVVGSGEEGGDVGFGFGEG